MFFRETKVRNMKKPLSRFKTLNMVAKL